jgi:hypothetical protein
VVGAVAGGVGHFARRARNPGSPHRDGKHGHGDACLEPG